MGFMGLSHWCDSDNAADFRYVLIEAQRKGPPAVRKAVNEELKDMANDYNTPGYINLALCLEVEGKEDGGHDMLPKFSHLLTEKQLQKASDLFAKELPTWENTELKKDAMRLEKVINTLLAKARKSDGKHKRS